MKKAVFGIARSEAQAVSIFNQLKGAAFADNDISILFPIRMERGISPMNSTPRLPKAPRSEQVDAS